MEEWKVIKNFEGLYEVSNEGRIRRVDGQVLSQTIRGKGYFGVCLHKNGRQFQRYTHRLVAEAFLANPSNYPCINHIDENKANNNISNIEWCDYKHNNLHGTRLERISKRLKGKRLSPETCKKMSEVRKGKSRKGKAVMCIETSQVYESAQKASLELGLYRGMVAQVCRGKGESAGGLHWKYL